MSLTEAEIELEKRIYDRLFTHFSVEIKDQSRFPTPAKRVEK